MRSDHRVETEVADALERAGLRVGLCVRDLDTGHELAIDAERPFPLASVVKLPLAYAILLLRSRGEGPPGDQEVRLDPAHATQGPSGTSIFRRPARIAVDDLLSLSMGVSDNTAADALFTLCPPERVTAALRERGHANLAVRHRIDALERSVVDLLGGDGPQLPLALAIRSGATGESVIPQLNIAHANVGTARSLVDLLADAWSCEEDWARRVRELLASTMMRQRLAPDLASDQSRWSSKTGTFLTLRHETGVLEEAGRRFAIAVLSESSIPARVQPAAEAALGEAAQAMVQHLRAHRAPTA